MEQQLKSSNKRIAINTIIIYVRMILIAFIGLFTTRYVLQALGVEDYGLYNVVGGIVTMFFYNYQNYNFALTEDLQLFQDL
jgi:O-antigen/teichoic acid export membrane protein